MRTAVVARPTSAVAGASLWRPGRRTSTMRTAEAVRTAAANGEIGTKSWKVIAARPRSRDRLRSGLARRVDRPQPEDDDEPDEDGGRHDDRVGHDRWPRCPDVAEGKGDRLLD